MGIKLVAIDLDDTLLNDNWLISARNQSAIFEAVRQGVVVTISTGRMYQSALPFARQLELDVPLIVYNGAMVKTSMSGELISHQPIDIPTAKKIFSLAQKNNWYVQTYINDSLYVTELNDYATEYAKIAKVNVTALGEDLYNIPEASTKIMIRDQAENLKLITNELKSTLNNKVSITTSKPTFLEITNAGVNKGAALAMLSASLGIDREDVMAIGDSGNDVAMLKFANWSVAMGNAVDEARAAARFGTGDNNADGVAQAIEKYVLT